MTTSAHDPLRALVDAHRTGTPLPTLEQLGGPSFLGHNMAALLEHDELPTLVGLVCEVTSAVEHSAGRDFLLAAAQAPQDPIMMEEVIHAFLAHPPAMQLLGDDLADAWLDVSRTRLDLLGGMALEASTRLVLAGAASEYGLLDRLRRLQRDLDRLDDGYAARTVRVAGAVAEHFDVPHIPQLLQGLLENEDVGDDAAYELGMLALRQALHADDTDQARALLLDARRHLTDALHDEQRPDATAFAAAIDALLAYSADLPAPQETRRQLDQAILELRMNLLRLPPGWRTPRLDTLTAWQSLLDTLGRAEDADHPGSWLHAGAVISNLVDVYTAHRTLDLLAHPEGLPRLPAPHGLHSLLAPRVERTLLVREGGIALLDRWLEELSHDHDPDPTTPIVREQAIALRRTLDLGGGSPPPKHERPATSLVGLGLSADDTQELETHLASRPELAQRLAAMTEARRARLPIDEVPIVSATYHDARRQLQQQCSSGYTGHFAADIDRMLLYLLRFIDLRLSETQNYGGDARAYLRRLKPDDDKPLEKELGKDLRDFLRGQGLQVRMEEHNVGGGRVDIAWQPHDERITLELKRDWEDPSWDAYAKKYLPQAISYQVAGPPVNFLVVLDLTDKPQGLAAIPACVHVRTVPGPAGDPRPRTVIMLRVQGNKRDPSDLPKMQGKSGTTPKP